MHFESGKIDRIATRILATFPERWDKNLNQTIPAGVVDYLPGGKTVYVCPGFVKEWKELFEAHSKTTSDARRNINKFYRSALVVIKNGALGSIRNGDFGFEIKNIQCLPSRNNGGNTFKECRLTGKFIEGTRFSPRILFVDIAGTRDTVILSVTDKDGNDLSGSQVTSLKKKLHSALQNISQGNKGTQKVYKTYPQN